MGFTNPDRRNRERDAGRREGKPWGGMELFPEWQTVCKCSHQLIFTFLFIHISLQEFVSSPLEFGLVLWLSLKEHRKECVTSGLTQFPYLPSLDPSSMQSNKGSTSE